MKTRARLGQHFLKDKKVLNSIIESAKLKKDDYVLEIGPGKGVLTRELLKYAGHVTAIEKDPTLGEKISEEFKNEIASGLLELVIADVRNIDLRKYNFSKHPFKLVANIPYYISGELLKMFLSGKVKPMLIVFLLQREVARRIIGKTATGGKESILSISVKVFGTPKYIQTVRKKAFQPEPAVSSAILMIEDINNKRFIDIDERKFFEVVKTGFAQKRKYLKSNLKPLIKSELLANIFHELNISSNVRAEDIRLEDWIQITHCLNKK